MHRDDARRTVDEYRLGVAGELENDLIDNLAAGEIDRAGFLRQASMLGVGMGMMGTVAGAFGAAPAIAGPRIAQKKGGRLRLGVDKPGKTLEPHLFGDHGTLVTGSIAGEFLVRARQDQSLQPELALSWSHSADLKTWTFKLRQGVKFANGQGFGARDVVATYARLLATGSQALSVYKGILSPGHVKAKNASTVVFTLDQPTATFPWLVSQATYQAIMLPYNYKLKQFQKGGTGVTTGAFALTAYKAGVSAAFKRNPGWWGLKQNLAGKPGQVAPVFLDGVDIKYLSGAAGVAALTAGTVDMLSQVNVATGRNLFINPKLQVFRTKSGAHRHISMMTRGPQATPNGLKNKLVRQAIAHTLDRPKLLKQFFNGYGSPGNESPFVPGFAATVPLAQRKLDLTKAASLLQQGGGIGGDVDMFFHEDFELPQLAQVVKAQAAKIGITINLHQQSEAQYYGGNYTGGAVGRGDTPWLNSPMAIVDWAHRPVPNALLTSAFISTGVWNEANWANAAFDKAAKSFLGAASTSDQRKYAKVCETILLDETPIIIPYFYDWVLAGKKALKGFKADPSSHVWLAATSLS
jgi:peptide/nickel transport system substrate-binding protein